jgi:ABC-2 type transport system ATP-binding protein
VANAVEVRGLIKTYDDIHAVDGIDLIVPAGQCVALLGPNGAGKTTTVEILEGYRRRNAGDVRVLGVDPQDGDRAWRSRIGIVLQQVSDLQELTVAEAVRHFAGYFQAARDPDDVIEAVRLTEKAGSRVRTLSGGQRRRLDVALGIIGRPELLFLDEPTTGFDPEARHEFWELIHSLKAEGTTILLTTHYLEEAEELADSVAVINRGRVVAEGDPAGLGGRHDGLATVTWQQDGAMHSMSTPTPTRTIAELAGQFDDGEIPQLQVLRPTLEDTYLELIEHDPHRAGFREVGS